MADTDNQPDNLDGQKSESLDDSLDNTETDNSKDQEDSLESDNPDTSDKEPSDSAPIKKPGRFKKIRQWLNLYLVLLAALILMAISIIIIGYEQSRHSANSTGIKSQNLSQSALNQLADSDSTIGSSQYVLNVDSSAVFAGQVLMRQSLEAAGSLQVGGTTSLNDLSVAGTGQFEQETVNNNLTVGGSSAVQGSVTIAKSLQVSGGGTFGGSLSAPQITTSDLQLNGDLLISRHINVTGSIPSRSSGPALGYGGSVSISGSDTAGSISINTGSNPPAGCFVTVNFSIPYSTTPYILVTPIGSAAGGLNYYVNRSTTSFSICDNSNPPAGSSFGFDYFVIG